MKYFIGLVLLVSACGEKPDLYFLGCYEGVSGIYKGQLKEKYTFKLDDDIKEICVARTNLHNLYK